MATAPRGHWLTWAARSAGPHAMVFQEFYEAHLPFVWRSLRRLGVQESSLKDATQDVFWVVHKKLPDFAPDAKVTTWLFRICMRITHEHRRRRAKHDALDDSHFEFAADDCASPADDLQKRRDLALLEMALERIEPDQRTVFMLFELEQMTGDEIAEVLEIPLGTVYSRLRLARQAFSRIAGQLAAKRRGELARIESAS